MELARQHRAISSGPAIETPETTRAYVGAHVNIDAQLDQASASG